MTRMERRGIECHKIGRYRIGRRMAGSLAFGALALAQTPTLILAGCGTPAQPLPPSLKLPVRVTDLAATRAGNQVSLAWTMPKRDTDKVALKGPVTVSICRSEGAAGGAQNCSPAGEISLAPGAKGAFADQLPAALISGPPRPLQYFVELKNRRGRSAGLSNAAAVLAGQSPAPVVDFAAALHKDGVVLHWAVGDSTQSIRLYRTLLSPPAKKKDSGPLPESAQPAEQRLLIDSDSGAALDKTVDYDQIYEYRAQRVARVELAGQALELAGEISAPVRIEVQDVFPPAVPSGLAAVATAGSAATPASASASIDLSWLPVTDRDLAGYVVYRREGDSNWQRISPAEPGKLVVGPAFHDADVRPGHTYRYSVTSISLTGHESKRSVETEETVAAP
jgi:hypothetical protein